tara:strand:- start:47 stop:175 length:129 start_codon:yes stop_codon:yes gene_type:complete
MPVESGKLAHRWEPTLLISDSHGIKATEKLVLEMEKLNNSYY